MKACITGHTSGIGLGLKTAFESRGIETVGLSRSTGFDLVQPGTIESMVAASRGCQIFVNNAHQGYLQSRLLFALHAAHGADDAFTMITIGSNSADGIKSHVHPYAREKIALDHAALQLQANGRWRLIHIRPGWVDTPRVASVNANKLAVQDVVDAVLWAMDRPAGVLVRSITLAPRSSG